ncbi:hypothetical protein C8Q78DRAFT_1078715 [Trametes maxima]|nr:hypothetical protein C8Q78DRAFT_1078715 [Trametes maxima]
MPDAAQMPATPAPTGIQTPHAGASFDDSPLAARNQPSLMTPVRAGHGSHADFQWQLSTALMPQTSEAGEPFDGLDGHQPLITPGNMHDVLTNTPAHGTPPQGAEPSGMYTSEPPSSALPPDVTQPVQTLTARAPINLSRYRQLAEAHGLHAGDQVDRAVEIATMSPNSAHVVIYSDVLACMNLMRKFREQQSKAAWQMPERALNQMYVIGRFALIAPLPYSWKNDVCTRVILDMLIKDGSLPKDTDSHPERTTIVMKKAALYASHVRSDVIKSEIQNSLKAPYKNILELTNLIIKPCKVKIELSTEILGGVAYVRSLVATKMAQRGITRLDRDMWELFEVRLGNTLEQHKTAAAQSIFLCACLANDIAKYGAYNDIDVRLVTTYSALQAAMFAAMRTAPGLNPVTVPGESAKRRGRRG